MNEPSGALGLTEDVDDIPWEATLYLINPQDSPECFAGRNVRAWFGEFSESPSKANWVNSGKISIIEGVGDFVPDWPELAMKTTP